MGNLSTCLVVITLLQCIKQAQWPETNPVLALPGMIGDGSRHGYAAKTMAALLSVPQNELDNRLPKEVSLQLTFN
jgi:hypothetical protein